MQLVSVINRPRGQRHTQGRTCWHDALLSLSAGHHLLDARLGYFVYLSGNESGVPVFPGWGYVAVVEEVESFLQLRLQTRWEAALVEVRAAVQDHLSGLRGISAIGSQTGWRQVSVRGSLDIRPDWLHDTLSTAGTSPSNAHNPPTLSLPRLTRKGINDLGI